LTFVVGLVAISVFEAILGRCAPCIPHTTNRIDAELGARLFRHLLALPLAYSPAAAIWWLDDNL
jgi:subfamily B ATP-binding cassette protein HlyB/CyaB